jgi:hypothetical protein
MVLGKLARIVDAVSACVLSAMNRYKGCLFGVPDVDMEDTWSTPLNGLEVEVLVITENLFVNSAQQAAVIVVILFRW